jgi:outer membrane immunogenic protein
MRHLTCALAAGAALCMGMSQVAVAAGLPVKAPVYTPPPAVVAYNWSGCYIGANGGWAWKDATYNIGHNNAGFFNPAFNAGSTVSNYDFDLDGAVIGVTVGCNYQVAPRFVIGIEADWDWADIDGSKDVATSVFPFVNGFGHVSEDIDSIGTARVRIGTTFGASNQFLAYLTGGLAWANVEYAYSWAYPATNELYVGSDSGWQTGWTLGGGIEWKAGSPITVKLEALYYELDGADFDAPGQTGVGPAGVAHLVSVDSNTGWMLRMGLNWHF